MRKLLGLLVALVAAPAWADSTVDALPVVTSPIPYGSSIYVSQGGVDSQLVNNPTLNFGTAFGLFAAPANTVFGNFTGSTGLATPNAVVSCPDVAGAHLNYVSGTGITCGTSAPTPPASLARTFTAGLNPTGTASLIGVMAGLAVAITPVGSGRLHIVITGVMTNSVASPSPDGGSFRIYYGTGSAPANGVALTGTALGAANSISGGTSLIQSFSLEGWVTGLTVGTAVWIDMLEGALGGGTATFSAIDVYVEEN